MAYLQPLKLLLKARDGASPSPRKAEDSPRSNTSSYFTAHDSDIESQVYPDDAAWPELRSLASELC